ncbi:hypothetical protein ES332_D04G082400v1 [Gossypium tomentosum]|uniref:Uncharacterized protein n=1 Tax=Gossypium tomentosum TaxID=34277 RepID=A0A5D2LBB4_GOSTO|nr:hypothetical protein ES332_D04G082400v1 [Gossypium tomentosum]
MHAYSPYAAGPQRNGCLVRCKRITARISYWPITLIACNRHYAPSAPIRYSASFHILYSIFYPHHQASDSPTFPCREVF